MKKKTAITLLTAIITICCMIVFAACGSGGNKTGDEIGGGVIGGDTHEHTSGLEYTLTNDGMAYSVSGIGTASETDISIPSEYNGRPVTSIGDYAFDGCTSITSVTIPSSVTSIGDYAFYACTSLISVTIPSGVTSIGVGAFCGCESLTSITIPSSVTSIGNEAFGGCTSLTGVTIPSSVTSIDVCAFSDCTALTSITVESGNNVYHSAGNCLIETASKTLIAGCNNSVIPNDGSVTSIDDHAFAGCSSLTSVTIPNSVTSIGGRAFERCSSLTSITIPSNVTSIDGWVFDNCESLTIYCEAASKPDGWISYWDAGGGPVVWDCNTNDVASDGNIYAVIDGVRYAIKGGEATVAEQPSNISGSIPIPISVTFKNNTYNVTSIDDYAFEFCTSLTSITIPSSVTSIGNDAFYACTSLISVTIEYGVTSIGDLAFNSCNSLTNVTIPGSVTSIGDRAFEECISLENVTIPGSVMSISDRAFEECISLENVTIEEGVTRICRDAFIGCTSLTSITIPSSVTSIGNDAFNWCASLTRITVNSGNKVYHSAGNCLISTTSKTLIVGCNNSVIPNDSSVTSINDYAFSGRTSLTSISIPSSVTSIGDYAFFGCTSFASVTIPSSVTSMGERVFGGCSALTSITMESGNNIYHSAGNCLIETASKTLVAGCKNSVIPSDGSVTSIGYSAFRDCDYLTSVTIPSSITSIDDYAFNSCKSLTSIIIPDSVTSVGWGAFKDCILLTSVTIPSSVTSISGFTFNGCSSLTNVYYGGTAEQWLTISIDRGNSILTETATRYYYSETNPFKGAGAVTEGNYWHYVNGVPTVWAK